LHENENHLRGLEEKLREKEHQEAELKRRLKGIEQELNDLIAHNEHLKRECNSMQENSHGRPIYFLIKNINYRTKEKELQR